MRMLLSIPGDEATHLCKVEGMDVEAYLALSPFAKDSKKASVMMSRCHICNGVRSIVPLTEAWSGETLC